LTREKEEKGKREPIILAKHNERKAPSVTAKGNISQSSVLEGKKKRTSLGFWEERNSQGDLPSTGGMGEKKGWKTLVRLWERKKGGNA